MAEEKKEFEPKIGKTEKFRVIKEFTLDKLYKVGNPIELPNGKTKDNLISNKFIK
jgi:hypothetical protein